MISLSKRLSKEYNNVEEFYYQDIPANTLFPIIDSSPINFEIPGLPNVFIDPQEIYISLELALRKPRADGGSEKIADEAVAFEQIPLYTIFKDINVSFNNETVETSYGYYAYKTYMAIMLSTTSASRESILTSALYAQDLPGALDTFSITNKNVNPGAYTRNRAGKSGKTIYLRGRLIADTLQVNKPILDRVSLSLTLYPADPKACLIATTGLSYLVEVQRCYLTVGRIVPKNPKIQICNYNFLRHLIKRIPHQKELRTINPIVLTRGPAPKYVTIGIVAESSLASYVNNRFNFGTFDLGNLTLRLDGKELPYSNGYNMNYDNNSYTQPFMGLYHELQNSDLIENNNFASQFPYVWFRGGYCLYVWNCQKAHGIKERQTDELGVLELTGRFNKDLTTNLIFIVMLSYENSYKINAHRNVIFDEKRVTRKSSK